MQTLDLKISFDHERSMRELLKKHSALGWTENRGMVFITFTVKGPDDALQAFSKDYDLLTFEWLSAEAW